MVKIRYSDLPVGLHVIAEREGRDTVVYLLPGLTPAQRRAALLRVRSSARMGHGPGLPAFGMALAIVIDRVRTTARNGVVAMRAHPMLLLPPMIVLVSSAIVVMLMSFVSVISVPGSTGGTVHTVGVTGSPAASQAGRPHSPSAPGGNSSR